MSFLNLQLDKAVDYTDPVIEFENTFDWELGDKLREYSSQSEELAEAEREVDEAFEHLQMVQKVHTHITTRGIENPAFEAMNEAGRIDKLLSITPEDKENGPEAALENFLVGAAKATYRAIDKFIKKVVEWITKISNFIRKNFIKDDRLEAIVRQMDQKISRVSGDPRLADILDYQEASDRVDVYMKVVDELKSWDFNDLAEDQAPMPINYDDDDLTRGKDIWEYLLYQMSSTKNFKSHIEVDPYQNSIKVEPFKKKTTTLKNSSWDNPGANNNLVRVMDLVQQTIKQMVDDAKDLENRAKNDIATARRTSTQDMVDRYQRRWWRYVVLYSIIKEIATSYERDRADVIATAKAVIKATS